MDTTSIGNKEIKFYLDDTTSSISPNNGGDDEDQWQTVGNASKQSAKPLNKSLSKPVTVNYLDALQKPDCDYDGNDDYINTVRDYIKTNKKKCLIIMRGIPGSGKSYLAMKIRLNGIILSADHCFYNENGVYLFDVRKLNDAHSVTKIKAKENLKEGISPIIIDNTNVKLWEFKPYIKMAYEHDYDVRLVEPQTKWKSNANELARRNQHGVPLPKIKQMLADYESNINLKQILNEFKDEQAKFEKMRNSMRKSSGLLFDNNVNLKSFLNTTNEWACLSDNILNQTQDDNVVAATRDGPHAAKAMPKSQTFSVGVKKTYLSKESQTVNGDTGVPSFFDKILTTNARDINDDRNEMIQAFAGLSLRYDKSCDTVDLAEHVDEEGDINTIKQMFPHLNNDDNLIKFYLKQYNYDLNTIATMLSDELSISDIDELSQAPQPPPPPLHHNQQLSSISSQIAATQVKYNPLSLKDLCEIYLNCINNALRVHYEREDTIVDDDDDVDELSRSSSPTQSQNCLLDTSGYSTMTSLTTTTTTKDDKFHRTPTDDNNLIHIKVSKESIKNLFHLFADSTETFNENESCDIDMDVNLAYELFKCWKQSKVKYKDKPLSSSTTAMINYSRTNSTCSEYGGSSSCASNSDSSNTDEDFLIEKKLAQIELDAQFALEIFEQENMRNPVDGMPLYLSDYGINSATISLRQIMAEQSAEEYQNRNYVQSTRSITYDPTLAIRIKRRQLYECYSNKIDKQVLDTIFVQNNYNFNETTKFIEKFYQIKIVDTPKQAQAIRRLHKSASASSSQSTSSFTYTASASSTDDHKSLSSEYRQIANEYFQIRQEYFDKATEAYARGWGAVAQYYAELGQKQSFHMKKTNEHASVNIFALNNANINDSNTLDLHGLHVNEAIKVFKEIYTKKRNDYLLQKNSTNVQQKTKQKTFMYIITGSGRHSVDRIARLRPRIINYLNQNSIKYKEPNIGLLRVDLV